MKSSKLKLNVVTTWYQMIIQVLHPPTFENAIYHIIFNNQEFWSKNGKI